MNSDDLTDNETQLQSSLLAIHQQIEQAAALVINRNEFVMNLLNQLYFIKKASDYLKMKEEDDETEQYFRTVEETPPEPVQRRQSKALSNAWFNRTQKKTSFNTPHRSFYGGKTRRFNK